MNPRSSINIEVLQTKHLGLIVAVVLAILAINSPTQAQVLYGSIVGNVKDKSDAVVSGATVRITNKKTNVTREQTAVSIFPRCKRAHTS